MDLTSEPLTQPRRARLRRTIALLLSVLGAGLGQVVMGHTKRGLKWFVSVDVAFAGFVGTIIAGPHHLAWLFAAIAVTLRLAGIVDTLRLPVPIAMPAKRRMVLIVAAMLVASELAGEATQRLIHADRQLAPSMYPTIEAGDHFVTSRVWGKLERGEIIVFDYPLDQTKSYIKRIVGLPGDTVEVRKGRLILNGSPVDTSATDDSCHMFEIKCTIWRETLGRKTYRIALVEESTVDPTAREFGPKVVPDGKLFVLGDNRDNSADSRYWGYVPMELVRAKPRFIYWSSDDSGTRWSRINQVLE